MIRDLTHAEKELADFMSDVSERCYSAGWMQNLEYVLWNALLNGPTNYGNGRISQSDIHILGNLSKSANAWIVFNDETEETAVDLHNWKKMFNEEVKKNLNF